MLRKIGVSIVLLLCMIQTAWAESTVGVKILSGTQTYTHEGFTVPVTIEFVDAQLYNEDVYFSYHVLAEDGSILRYENERIPLSLENGKTTIELNVQCLAIPELESVDTAQIQFDLVDQKNVYWLRDRGLIEEKPILFERSKLQGNEVYKQDSSLKQSDKAASEQISIALNGIVWLAIVIGIVYCYRRRKCNNRKCKYDSSHQLILEQANSQDEWQQNAKILISDRRIVILLVVISFFIPFIIYHQNIFQQDSIVSGDGLTIFYSFSYLKYLLETGEFLLWNPYLAGGMPQGIMVGAPGLYPLNWLTAMVPVSMQFCFYLGIHLAIGSGFLYKYLRKISCGQLVSIAVSIMYVFTIHMGGARKEHINLIVTALYIPVIFYFAERYLQERKLKWLFCCSVAMALQFLCGFLQYVIYADIVVFLYLLTSGFSRKIPFVQMLKHGVVWFLSYFGMVMGVILGTAQFMLLLSSNSGDKMSLDIFSGLSLHPIKLLMTVFPEIFGSDVWGGLINKGNYTSGMDAELVLGAAVVCMIVASFSLLKKSFYSRFMTGLLFGTLIYACLGQFDLLAKIIYHVPILNMFRIPSRTLFLFTFAEMVLVALSLEALCKEKAQRKILHYVNVLMIICFVIVIVLYNENVIPYDEKLPIKQVFVVPCILFAIYLIVFYGSIYLHEKGFLSAQIAKIGIVLITAITMIVQVMPYYTFAYIKPMKSVMAISNEFVHEVGTDKIWTLDQSCEEIVTNSSVVYPIQGLNSYTNFNLPYLYQYTASVNSAPMNYSGLYKGFSNVTGILRTKNDLISMMGVKYLLLSPEIDAETCTEVQVTAIEKNLLSVENSQFSAGTGYQIASWPVELESNSYYQIDVNLSSEAEGSAFYIDFCGVGYDNAEQEQGFVLKDGSNQYSALIFTGDCSQVDDIQFRIVASTMKPIQIGDVKVNKVSVSEEQLYKLNSTNKYNVYENLNAKELIYAPKQVKPISEKDINYLYTQTQNYDILNTSYIEGIDEVCDFSQIKVEVNEIELNNNSATAQVVADGDCFVNFSQTYYPGWKAYVDGKETEVYMVNGIIQGVFVPEGTHTVEFRFVPIAFYVGTVISILTLAACIGYSIYEHKKYGR